MRVQVIEAHAAYLKRILKGTLLSRKVKLLQQLNSIINVGHRFGETTRRLEEKTALDPVPLEDPATGMQGQGLIWLYTACCCSTRSYLASPSGKIEATAKAVEQQIGGEDSCLAGLSQMHDWLAAMLFLPEHRMLVLIH